MIIEKIKLKPFGCFASKEIDFQEGLNVIIGPNEAGKSTAFYGIQKILFTSTELTKNEFKREIKNFLPIDGDTASVKISFIINKKSFCLERTWGGTKASVLKLADGTLITDDGKIQKELEDILPATAGTFNAVLMSYQTGLANTIEDLKSTHRNTVQTLGDILRKALFETDGVSIDKFKESIENLYQDYYSHWDNSKQQPEKGKGVENRWKNKVGKILEHYYHKERLGVDLEVATEYEEKLDNINQQITKHSEKISSHKEFIKKNEKAVIDASERRILNAELNSHKIIINEFTEINSDWPVRESKINDLEKQLPELEKHEQSLAKERQDSENDENNKKIREQFQKINVRKTGLDNSLQELSNVQKLTKENLKAIVFAERDMITAETKISAGKLVLKFETKKEISFTVQKDTDENKQFNLFAGELQEMTAGGILKIEHKDWDMEITSGDENFSELILQYSIAKKKYENLLKQYNVDSKVKAEETYNVYEKHDSEVIAAQKLFDSELGNDSYEELKSKVMEIGEQKATRPIADIVQDLTTIKHKRENLRDQKSDHERAIGKYKNKYEDKNKLLLEFAEKSLKFNEIQEKIDKLTPLPEEIIDLDKLVEEFEKVKVELDDSETLMRDCKLQIANLEGQAPEMSVEELGSQLSDANENFMRMLRKGKAIYKIKELTEELTKQLDGDTHIGLKKELEYYVSEITGKRYNKIAFSESLPDGFVREDGKTVPYELLSTGTKDVLSLSLRLSMASYFIKEANGFIVMDDPLVDLDPERQKNASKVLQTFACDKQVIVLTCHPTNAKLLGGNLINL